MDREKDLMLRGRGATERCWSMIRAELQVLWSVTPLCRGGIEKLKLMLSKHLTVLLRTGHTVICRTTQQLSTITNVHKSWDTTNLIKMTCTFDFAHLMPHWADLLICLFLLSLQAHKNCQNMTEIEAKVSYVKLARSLKTYGVSFFLVKVRRSSSLNNSVWWIAE